MFEDKEFAAEIASAIVVFLRFCHTYEDVPVSRRDVVTWAVYETLNYLKKENLKKCQEK